MALQTPDELRALAKCLTGAADAYDERLKRDVDSGKLSDQDVYARISEERMLRDKAKLLYLDAATRTVQGLAEDQEKIESSIGKANKLIAELQDFKKVLVIVADLIGLAGSVVSGKPATIVAALKALRNDTGETRSA